MEKTYAILLPEDNGNPKKVEFKGNTEGLGWYYKLIGCDFIEVVRTVIPNAVLVVDEEFLLKGEPSLNAPATALSGGGMICGNVLLLTEEYGPEGIEFAGLPEENADRLVKLLTFMPPTEE